MTELTIDDRREGDRHVLLVRGDLAAVDIEDFAAPAVDALGDRAVRTLVLDLGGVTFVDSSGIGALVSLRSTAADVGANLVLRNPTTRIVDLLRLVKMDTLFAIEEPDPSSG